MNVRYETRLKELEAKPNRTPAEESVRVALLDFDEKTESKADQATIAAAQKAVDDAEAAIA